MFLVKKNIFVVLGVLIFLGVSPVDGRASGVSASYLPSGNTITQNNSKYCGAHTVWHALHYFNREKSIGELVFEMRGAAEEGVNSIKEIVEALELAGLSTKAVRLSKEEIRLQADPFVMYVPPRKINQNNIQIGHFVFCVPDGNGVFKVSDGARDHYTLKVSDLLKGATSQFWDGTSILIDPGDVSNDWRFIEKILLIIVFIIIIILLKLNYRKSI